MRRFATRPLGGCSSRCLPAKPIIHITPVIHRR